MTCASRVEAFAFCIWDGGRLPTEAEWNAAAAGGSEQRIYPWGSDPIDASHALYGIGTGGAPVAVGTHPLGNGKWGHADLAGNVAEWVLDTYVSPYAITPCNDCADHTAGGPSAMRGGAFYNNQYILLASARSTPAGSVVRDGGIGFRCVRTP